MQKSKFFNEVFWRNHDLKFFPYKIHVPERIESVNEVCKGVAGLKNHSKKCCWP